mmetsp:Transcript_36965/g.54241  ORF Transcript_36965/g.54241 Transcript_36965/m.54241 type:complete len:251 (-) Transcript_36965:3802-4554(-)
MYSESANMVSEQYLVTIVCSNIHAASLVSGTSHKGATCKCEFCPRFERRAMFFTTFDVRFEPGTRIKNSFDNLGMRRLANFESCALVFWSGRCSVWVKTVMTSCNISLDRGSLSAESSIVVDSSATLYILMGCSLIKIGLALVSRRVSSAKNCLQRVHSLCLTFKHSLIRSTSCVPSSLELDAISSNTSAMATRTFSFGYCNRILWTSIPASDAILLLSCTSAVPSWRSARFDAARGIKKREKMLWSLLS